MNRRDILFSGLAMSATPALGLGRSEPGAPVLDDIPDFQSYRTLAETRRWLADLQAAHPGLISRRKIGDSRYGEPIELVTLAGGKRSALVIAGVHANEQVGGLTVEYLLSRLAADTALRSRLDTSWHFITPIDPDGLRLNEGWFKEHRSLPRVMHDYYRPAFDHQPDYTFPIDLDGYAFTRSTPENLAWQRALEITRPDWQFPIHNAGIGGAFFFTSRPIDRLDRTLSATPAKFGLDLDPVGEPLSNFPARSPGISTTPRGIDMIGKAVPGKARSWTAGGTSADFALRYGTFSITAEVPVWVGTPVAGWQPSFHTIADVVEWRLETMRRGFPILDKWASSFQPRGSAEDELLCTAFAEQVAMQRRQLAGSGKPTGEAPSRPLSAQESLNYRADLPLIVMRPHALLARIARNRPEDPVASTAEREAQAFVDAQINDLNTVTQIAAAPLRSLVGVQATAAFATAEAVVSGSISRQST